MNATVGPAEKNPETNTRTFSVPNSWDFTSATGDNSRRRLIQWRRDHKDL